MALTQGDWTKEIVNGVLVLQCTVSGTDDNDVMTLITPDELDGSYPFTLVVDPAEDLTAASAAAVDIWGCWSDKASLATGDAGTDCALVAANSLDIDAGIPVVIHVLPGVDGNVTQVTNASPGWSVVPPCPHYIFNVDLTGALQDAADVVFTVYQKNNLKGI